MIFTNSSLKLAQSIDALRTSLIVTVTRNSERIEQLEKQITEMASRVGELPQPNRENWERHSARAWEKETLTYPVISVREIHARAAGKLEARISGKLALLPPPPRKIAHMYFCEHGSAQFVYAYDINERPLKQYTGWVREIGVAKLLAVSAGVVWEEKKPGTPEWNAVFSTVSA